MLWEVDIYPAPGCPDRTAETVSAAAAALGLGANISVATCYGYLLEGDLDEQQAVEAATGLLADAIVERTVVRAADSPDLATPPPGATGTLVHVLPRPGPSRPLHQCSQRPRRPAARR